jgi:hypothetical protein
MVGSPKCGRLTGSTPWDALTPFLAIALLIGPSVHGAAGQPTAGHLEGSVRLASDLTPLVGARVMIAELDLSALSDSAGYFRIEDVPAGEHEVIVGFLSMVSQASPGVTATIREDRTTEVELLLDIAVLPVPALVVEIEALVERGKMRGFERRRATTFGRFITRQEIERLKPSRLSQLFYGVPGVRIIRSPTDPSTRILSTTRSGGVCAMDHYLDGIRQPLNSGFTIDLLPPDDIEGIEIYAGSSRSPAIFSYRGARCGVVAIWTRDPARR